MLRRAAGASKGSKLAWTLLLLLVSWILLWTPIRKIGASFLMASSIQDASSNNILPILIDGSDNDGAAVIRSSDTVAVPDADHQKEEIIPASIPPLSKGPSSDIPIEDNTAGKAEDKEEENPLTDIHSPYSNTTAVALIAFGNATRTRIIERCLTSLRTRGEYHGWVMLVTDNTIELQQRLLPNYDRLIILPAKDRDLIPMNPQTGRAIRYHSQNMVYKRFKTMLLDYFEEDPRLAASSVQHILYIDVDVVTVRPLNDFFQGYEETRQLEFEANAASQNMTSSTTHNNVTSFMSMFLDNPDFGHQHNTGTIVLDRKYSNYCLQEWKILFDTKRKKANRDQKFTRLMARISKSCWIRYLDRKHILFPSTDAELVWSDIQANRRTTFVHCTNSWHSTLLSRKVQEDFYGELLQTRANGNNSAGIAEGISEVGNF